VTQCLGTDAGPPTVAASDYMKALPDGIRAWVPGRFEVLGTDGFGRSDFRAELRDFFEVDDRHIAVAALHSLAETGEIERSVVEEAIARYEINTDRSDPAGL
jgi:pyruvate dehydrogenase E1 component